MLRNLRWFVKMNLNIIAYIIYITLTYFVTVKVGLICYRNGIYYLEQELEDTSLAQIINKLLLVGYYLLNLGYASIMIFGWEEINSVLDLINSISKKTGSIILLLGCLHCINMTAIYLLRKKKTL